MRRWIAAATALLAGCATNDEWRWQKTAWEHEPLIRRTEDIDATAGPLRTRAELTLDECWTLALARSDSLALTGEELVRLQTTYEQAVSAVLPRVNVRASWTRQDLSGGDESRAEYKIFARQPIFTGLRDYHLIRQADRSFESKEHDLRQGRLLVFADVAEAFFAVLQAERELDTTRSTLKLAEERLEELTERQKAQISRRSEVLAQEAEVASTQAQVERLKGALSVAWDTLRFVTGVEGIPRLWDTIAAVPRLPALEGILAAALERRHDLRSFDAQLAAAREGRGIARAGYLPTATLEGNVYTHREGSESDWDVTLSIDIPVFEGGATQSKLREADSLIRSAGHRISQLRRIVDLEVRRAHSDATALQAQLASLDKEVASADENHQLVQAEYRQGIVANVEVLTSFNILQQARLDRDRARTALKLAFVRLAVQSGVLPGELR